MEISIINITNLSYRKFLELILFFRFVVYNFEARDISLNSQTSITFEDSLKRLKHNLTVTSILEVISNQLTLALGSHSAGVLPILVAVNQFESRVVNRDSAGVAAVAGHNGSLNNKIRSVSNIDSACISKGSANSQISVIEESHGGIIQPQLQMRSEIDHRILSSEIEFRCQTRCGGHVGLQSLGKINDTIGEVHIELAGSPVVLSSGITKYDIGIGDIESNTSTIAVEGDTFYQFQRRSNSFLISILSIIDRTDNVKDIAVRYGHTAIGDLQVCTLRDGDDIVIPTGVEGANRR